MLFYIKNVYDFVDIIRAFLFYLYFFFIIEIFELIVIIYKNTIIMMQYNVIR